MRIEPMHHTSVDLTELYLNVKYSVLCDVAVQTLYILELAMLIQVDPATVRFVWAIQSFFQVT
jgi:hypothetical protein